MKKIILIGILVLVLVLVGCETTPTPEVTKTSEPTKSAEQAVDEYLENIEDKIVEDIIEEPKQNVPKKEEGYKELITLKGKGNSDTESFEITSSKVKIVARTDSSVVGSYSSIELQSEDGDDMLNTELFIKGLRISGEAGKEGYGETILRDLPDGKYYISVISGIGWEVTIYEYI